MNRRCLTLALLLSVGLAGAAHADVVPLAPDVFACASLTVGSPCTYNGPGTCQNATCTDSANPTANQYNCVKCVPTKDSSGCAVGGRLARTVGLWLAAGLFGAATMLARRRPRR